jgi:diadenosine tetraphosphate (Ap4A) HIT family hydrolase
MMEPNECELCAQAGGELLFDSARWRVVLVDDPAYPGFCRVIWRAHVKEMTDLTPAERNELMDAVWQVETAVRTALQPDKVNLATLGNVVPHLHWHVIPRYADDAQFPAPIWAAAQRTTPPDILTARRNCSPALRAAITKQLSQR